MFTAKDDIIIQQRFDELLSICDSLDIYKRDDDRDKIIRGFKFANEAHYGVRRKSGEPYIVHPIAVARIAVEEIGLGVKSVLAALLHDVVEDTDFSVEDIERHFGKKISEMVDGLTKMKAATDCSTEISHQAENFKKMLLTLSNDVRVIIIKLADRLHNMRTLGSMTQKKQVKIFSETMYLFAPLANRLGLYKIKSELEDLSLKYNFPEDYRLITDKLKETETERDKYINMLKVPISEKLDAANIDHEITGRAKSVYSIWKKMQRKQISLDEVYDLFAIRIIFKPVDIVPEKAQCWHIYSIITELYKPRPDRLREWINIPKANGYEALHCTVMGPRGRWAEVQIRSERMNEIAEKGFAAHWKYKEFSKEEGELDKWIKEVRDALNSSTNDAVEFLDEFHLNLYSSEVIIFTPKGETKTMPKGATALDFAYDIHSSIGNKAIGAKINYKIQSLYTELVSGDQVEVLTSKNASPKVEWMNKVFTAKAKQHIKNYFKVNIASTQVTGKEIFDSAIQKQGIKPSSALFKKILPAYNCAYKDEFYSKLAMGVITLDDLDVVVKSSAASKIVKYWSLQFNNTLKLLGGNNKNGNSEEYKISECCFPSPGDDVIGFKQSDDLVIVVHKKSCPEALREASRHGDTIVPTKWSSEKIMSYLSHISLSGSDRIGILLDLSFAITKQMNVNIRKIKVDSHDGIFEGNISLYVKNDEDLKNIMDKISSIKGIDNVHKYDEDTVVN